ncbi:protein ENHANCED DISEASE RESISTANCE 2-like [Rutidosis leptorrhynchoides]|uniref:protein ENHANCED DISEASE RESISTANCE 2-like n=1 Tax=Rutidosis leptorrhynchoides TaxID=125765 RepID=UPI003A9A3B3C
MNPKTAENYEPSYWTIFGCHNGLRFFKHAKDQESKRKSRHPALAAIGVIEDTPNVVFQTLMSLGSSRTQWDFCFKQGSVIETIDAHTDIIHKQLYDSWLPWGMKRRDLLLHRYWMKDDNGTYIILYHSVLHDKCPPQKGFIRASLISGGYVISPGNRYKQSVVRHMLAIDWKHWRSYLQKSFAGRLTIKMLERLAALRELFKTNLADYLLPEFTSHDLKKYSFLHKKEKDQYKRQTPSDDYLMKMEDESDEFFDCSEPLFDDELNDNQAVVVVEKKVTLPEDQTGNLPNSWSSPEPSIFQIRGETFFEDRKKITAENTLLHTVAVDWIKSDKREDHLASRPGNIVQKYAAEGRSEFFIVVNFQVPGTTMYNLASYHTIRTSIKDIPLLERFVNGDDSFRNSRIKVIPHVTKGPWVLKQTIRKPTLIGNMLKINYIFGKNYLEMDVDVGSSTSAKVLAGKAFSCFSSLIVDMAFVIQGNTQEELPEHLIGAFRLSHLDVSKAVWANS